MPNIITANFRKSVAAWVAASLFAVAALWARDAQAQSAPEAESPMLRMVVVSVTTFTANPEPGWFVSGWTGACAESGASAEIGSANNLGQPRTCAIPTAGLATTVGVVFDTCAAPAELSNDETACVCDPPYEGTADNCQIPSSGCPAPTVVNDAGTACECNSPNAGTPDDCLPRPSPSCVGLDAGARDNDAECVRFWIGRGANVNMTFNAGNTALHFAAANSATMAASVLIENGANQFARNNAGRAPHQVASFIGDLDLEKFISPCKDDELYQAQANSCACPYARVGSETRCFEMAANMHALAVAGNEAARMSLTVFLASHPSVFSDLLTLTNRNGNTPLQSALTAAVRPSLFMSPALPAIVSLFIANGADVSLFTGSTRGTSFCDSRRQWNFFQYVALSGTAGTDPGSLRLSVLAELGRTGLDANRADCGDDDRPLLLYAASGGLGGLLTAIVKAKSRDLNTVNADGHGALANIILEINGNWTAEKALEAVGSLLDNGADIAVKDIYGRTLLDILAARKNLGFIGGEDASPIAERLREAGGACEIASDPLCAD